MFCSKLSSFLIADEHATTTGRRDSIAATSRPTTAEESTNNSTSPTQQRISRKAAIIIKRNEEEEEEEESYMVLDHGKSRKRVHFDTPSLAIKRKRNWINKGKNMVNEILASLVLNMYI